MYAYSHLLNLLHYLKINIKSYRFLGSSTDHPKILSCLIYLWINYLSHDQNYLNISIIFHIRWWALAFISSNWTFFWPIPHGNICRRLHPRLCLEILFYFIFSTNQFARCSSLYLNNEEVCHPRWVPPFFFFFFGGCVGCWWGNFWQALGY